MNGYSRFIRFTRVLLLIAGCGLLGSLLIFSRVDPIRSVPVIDSVDVAGLATGQQMVNPQFSGVTERGDAYSMFAQSAQLSGSGPDSLVLESPQIEIEFTDRRILVALSRQASLNLKEQNVVLEGGVHISTSDGFHATTQKILVDFRKGRALSPLKVRASGPFGTIEAGSMEIFMSIEDPSKRQVDPDAADSILMFGNGVRVVFSPEPRKV
ncbi:MAG: LPS export ABC transporter periplasmic protein LptC [Paracoccaceae bacterium]|nr:LPS export ABC transporter periplasmic protein LptC [Paracoccaceae bacterium]MDE2913556.1 LPS export ABC transporter periplasmic protein LptC [Paracoccaceae bacterium]